MEQERLRLVEGFVRGDFTRIREDGFAGNFGPNFQTATGITIGGLAAGDPGLQDELDKLVRKWKRKELRRDRRRRKTPLFDNDRVSRIVNAILAVKAVAIVRGQ